MDHKDELKKALDAEDRGFWQPIRRFFKRMTESTGIQPGLRPAVILERDESPEERLARYRNDARYRFMGRGFY